MMQVVTFKSTDFAIRQARRQCLGNGMLTASNVKHLQLVPCFVRTALDVRMFASYEPAQSFRLRSHLTHTFT